MMKASKILVMLLALVLVVSLVACGGTKDPEVTDDAAATTTKAPTTTTKAAATTTKAPVSTTAAPATTTAAPVASITPSPNTIDEFKSLYVADGNVFHLNFAEATPDSPALVGSDKYEDETAEASNRFNAVASNYTDYLFNSTVDNPVAGGTAKILSPWYFSDWYADWTGSVGSGSVADMRTVEPEDYASTTDVSGTTVYVVNTVVEGVTDFYLQGGKWAKRVYASTWGDGYLTLGSNSTLNFSGTQSQVIDGAGYTLQFTAQRVGAGSLNAFTGMRVTINPTTGIAIKYNNGFKYLKDGSTFETVNFESAMIDVPNMYTFSYDRRDTSAVGITVYLNATNGGTQTVAENTTLDNIFKLFESADSNVYAIRLYNRVLTDAEVAQNYFADLAIIAQLDITEYLTLDDAAKASVHTALASYTADIPQMLIQNALNDAVAAAK